MTNTNPKIVRSTALDSKLQFICGNVIDSSSPLRQDSNVSFIARTDITNLAATKPTGYPTYPLIRSTGNTNVYTLTTAQSVGKQLADWLTSYGYVKGLGEAFRGQYAGAISLKNFGVLASSGKSLLRDPADAASGNSNVPFYFNAARRDIGTTSSLLADNSLTIGNWAKEVFSQLKNELDARNICYPLYLIQDLQEVVDFTTATGPGGWFNDAKNVARYSTEVLYREWNGSSWANKTLLDAYVEAGSPAFSTSAFYYQSVNVDWTVKMFPYMQRITDRALSIVLYETAKEVFPEIMCGNFGVLFPLSSTQTEQYWEKDNNWLRTPYASYSYNRYLQADCQVPVCFGPTITPGKYWTDNYLPPPVPTGSGSHIFGVSQSSIHTNWCSQTGTCCTVSRNPIMTVPYVDEPLGIVNSNVNIYNTKANLLTILQNHYIAGVRKWVVYNPSQTDDTVSSANQKSADLNEVIQSLKTWIRARTTAPRVRLVTSADQNVGYDRPNFYFEIDHRTLSNLDPQFSSPVMWNHALWDRDNTMCIITLESRFQSHVNRSSPFGAGTNLGTNFPLTYYGLGQTWGEIVSAIRDKYNSTFPTRTFKWAMNVGGLGTGDGVNQLTEWGEYSWYEYPTDKINSPTLGLSDGPYFANGINAWRNRNISFFDGLKNRLDFHGVPYPKFCYCDYERRRGSTVLEVNSGNHAGTIISSGYAANNPAQCRQSYLDIKNDTTNRYYTQLFDGRQTLETFFNNLTDLNGVPILESQRVPTVFGSGADHALVVNVHQSIGCLTSDWALQKMIYEPAKIAFGSSIITGMYNNAPASRAWPTPMSRFKETPVDNSNMYADIGIESLYGLTNFGLENVYQFGTTLWPVDNAFMNQQTILSRYGIAAQSGSYTANDQLRDGLWAHNEYVAKAMYNASGGKENCIWMTYAIFQGTETFDATKWLPSGATYSLSVDNQLQLFKRIAPYKIKHIGCFEGNNSTLQQSCDFWESMNLNLHTMGYKKG